MMKIEVHKVSYSDTQIKQKSDELNRGGAFDKQKLYELLRGIPYGRVVTYGRLAEMLGNSGWARAVGNALHNNPDGERFPCYKVVNGNGKLSAAYAFGGAEEQKRRLEAEGILVENLGVDLEIYGL